MRLVVDASVLAAMAFGEPRADEAADRLRDGILYAPGLLDYELASVCHKKVVSHPGSADTLAADLEDALSLPITRVEVPAVNLVPLAWSTGLTTYDAAYLWLSVHLDAELVTFDARLARATS